MGKRAPVEELEVHAGSARGQQASGVRGGLPT